MTFFPPLPLSGHAELHIGHHHIGVICLMGEVIDLTIETVITGIQPHDFVPEHSQGHIQARTQVS